MSEIAKIGLELAKNVFRLLDLIAVPARSCRAAGLRETLRETAKTIPLMPSRSTKGSKGLGCVSRPSRAKRRRDQPRAMVLGPVAQQVVSQI